MVMSMGYGTMVLGHGWLSGAATSGGKSAVQLLQESKSRYVKSDRVLISRQEPTRPDHLYISANPNIFLSASSHTLHASKPPHDPHHPTAVGGGSGVNGIAPAVLIPPPVPPRTRILPLTSAALSQHLYVLGSGSQIAAPPPPLPSRFPRGAPRLRAKTQPVSNAWARGGDLRRSLSHGPADRSNTDVQMKLRKLLNTDSKESVNHEQHRRSSQNDSGTFRAEVAAVTIHKSLPELACEGSPERQIQSQGERRPSCPGFLAFGGIQHSSCPPLPPPRPPRRNKDNFSSPKPPPRPPPPKIPPRTNKGDDSGVSVFSNVASSDDFLSGEDDCNLDREETRRRPILRSKSDVTHERNGVLGAGSLWGEDDSSRRSSVCSDDAEQFFDSMGLDGTTFKNLDSLTHSSSSPPIYFEEITSEESGGGATGGRRASSDSDELLPTLNTSGLTAAGVAGFLPPSMKRGMEPSIIEKNARVIKWLFKCQKARSVIIPRSLSSGS